MENKEYIFVYYDRRDDYNYSEISLKEKEITPERVYEYFGRAIEDYMDNNQEMIIYKLVPYKTIKKNVKYEFV